MKKLTLHLDDLRIESFGTDDAVARGGTVNGAQLTRRYEATCAVECYAYTEPGFGTYGGAGPCVRC